MSHVTTVLASLSPSGFLEEEQGPAQHAGHHSAGLGCVGAKLPLHLAALQVWLCPALLNLLLLPAPIL